jgi:DMSO reductase anchor subunit
MITDRIRIVWLTTVLLSIPPIASVPVWPGFLTAQLAWGALTLFATTLAIRSLLRQQEKRMAKELFSVLVGLGIGLIASQIFSTT